MNFLLEIIISLFISAIVLFIILSRTKTSTGNVAGNTGTMTGNTGTVTGNPVNKDFKDFPNVKGALIIGNYSSEDINVYLDALKPPYTSDDNGCVNFGTLCWTDDRALTDPFIRDLWEGAKGAQFYLYTGSQQTAVLKGYYKQMLSPGQYWVIVLPKDFETGLPIWCPGKLNPVSCQNAQKCGRVGCSGTGGWVESTKSNIPKPKTSNNEDMFDVPQQATRFEFYFDVDQKQVYYNLSAVDGINSSLILNYDNTACNNPTSSCVVDLSSCPFPVNPKEIPPEWNYHTCPSPIHVDIDKTGCDPATDCAGCGGNTNATTQCLCRRWWATNKDALAWKSFLSKCDVYAWAYDELVLDNPNCDCSTGLCSTSPNPVNPLRKCPITPDGSLRVKVVDVKTK